MPKYTIPVTWVMSGHYIVEAESREEAQDKVLESEEPYSALPEGEYMDDSLRIDLDLCRELDEEEEPE
jgi:hypothetical protein